MIARTKTLQLVFLNGKNKKTNLTVQQAADDLDSATVKAAMNTIAEADAFAKEGVDLYQVPQSASYIERVVTNLFDNSATESKQFAAAGSNRANH